MKTSVVRSTLVLALLLFAVGSLPQVFAANGASFQATGTLGPANTLLSPLSLTRVDVTIRFSPSTVSGAPGGTVSSTLTADNKQTVAFTVTGCAIFIKAPGSTKYVRSTCSVSSSFTIAAHGKATGTLSFGISSTAPAGAYSVKFYLTNSADESHAGLLTIDVT